MTTLDPPRGWRIDPTDPAVIRYGNKLIAVATSPSVAAIVCDRLNRPDCRCGGIRPEGEPE